MFDSSLFKANFNNFLAKKAGSNDIASLGYTNAYSNSFKNEALFSFKPQENFFYTQNRANNNVLNNYNLSNIFTYTQKARNTFNLSTFLTQLKTSFTGIQQSQKPSSSITPKSPEQVETQKPVEETPQVQEPEVVEEVKKDLGINGLIDENIIQGQTGDCWILSSLLALSTTKEGRAVIKNSIKQNSDGSVNVQLKGINKTYTVSQEEIETFDTDDDKYDSLSNGDNDALAFEIAVAKLRMDLADGKVRTGQTFLDYNNGRTQDFSMAIEGGCDVAMLYYMTGNTPKAIKLNSNKEETYNALRHVLNHTNQEKSAVVIDLAAGVSNAECENGLTYNAILDGIHSIAMKSITEDTITFVDPWDTSKSYEMSWEEFAKLNLSQIAYIDLK